MTAESGLLEGGQLGDEAAQEGGLVCVRLVEHGGHVEQRAKAGVAKVGRAQEGADGEAGGRLHAEQATDRLAQIVAQRGGPGLQALFGELGGGGAVGEHVVAAVEEARCAHVQTVEQHAQREEICRVREAPPEHVLGSGVVQRRLQLRSVGARGEFLLVKERVRVRLVISVSVSVARRILLLVVVLGEGGIVETGQQPGAVARHVHRLGRHVQVHQMRLVVQEGERSRHAQHAQLHLHGTLQSARPFAHLGSPRLNLARARGALPAGGVRHRCRCCRLRKESALLLRRAHDIRRPAERVKSHAQVVAERGAHRLRLGHQHACTAAAQLARRPAHRQ
mmetsp:Transcript_27576/g.69139  ORF Transcript_27576/g.69139 Transcript_27576/m.69139 type:complete len:336 (+) Transcript_27576:169-1176(+)